MNTGCRSIRKNTASPTATLMEYLTEDLIVEILSRLPVKSLLRFSCVCKSWYTRITDPDFAKTHLRRSLVNNNNRSLIFYNHNSSALCSVDLDACVLKPAVGLSHPVDYYKHRIIALGSCNGLLCLSCDGFLRSPRYHQKGHVHYIFLWNPCTRTRQNLPTSSVEYQSKCKSNKCEYCRHQNNIIYRFGYDPNIIYGFGYDPSSNDYKLVRIAWDSEVKVYSLNTNSWRRIGNMPFNFKLKNRSGVLANSALHWIRDDRYSNFLVVSFDLKDEEFREVPLPDYVSHKFPKEGYVGELGGQLCLLGVVSDVCTQVWVMKEYGVKESWVKQYTFERSLWDIRSICYSKNGEVILVQNYKELFVFDPRTGRVRIPWNFGSGGKRVRCEIWTFVGSLVLLNSKDGSDQEEEDGMDWQHGIII